MKNTITRMPALPALPDTPLLNYAKGFLSAGQVRPKQNIPGGAARNGMADEPPRPQRRNIIPKPALADTGNLGYDDLNSDLPSDRFPEDDYTDLNADLRAYDRRSLRGIGA